MGDSGKEQKVDWVKDGKGQKGAGQGKKNCNSDDLEITALLYLIWIRIMTLPQIFGSQLHLLVQSQTIETLEKGVKYVQS